MQGFLLRPIKSTSSHGARTDFDREWIQIASGVAKSMPPIGFEWGPELLLGTSSPLPLSFWSCQQAAQPTLGLEWGFRFLLGTSSPSCPSRQLPSPSFTGTFCLEIWHRLAIVAAKEVVSVGAEWVNGLMDAIFSLSRSTQLSNSLLSQFSHRINCTG